MRGSRVSDTRKVYIGGVPDRTGLDVGGRGIELDQRLADAGPATLGERREIGLADCRGRSAGQQDRAMPGAVLAFENHLGRGSLR
jgi:hypothetical protein